MTAGAIEAGNAVVRLQAKSTLKRDLAKQLRLVRNFARSAKTAVSSVFSGFTGLAKLGLAGGGATAAAGGFLVKLAADAETTQIIFKNLIGDAGTARKLLEELNQFADRTPFQNEDIHQTAKLLIGTGTAVKDVNKEIKVLATLAAKAGSSTSELALILQDIRGKGKIDTQDIRQFASRGLGLREALQEELGLDAVSLQARISSPLGKGAIGPQEVERALQRMADKLPGLIDEASNSLNGMLSTFIGQLRATGKELGKILIEDFDLKNLLSDAIAFLKENKTQILDVFREIVLNLRVAALQMERVGRTMAGWIDWWVRRLKANASLFGNADMFADADQLRQTLRWEMRQKDALRAAQERFNKRFPKEAEKAAKEGAKASRMHDGSQKREEAIKAINDLEKTLPSFSEMSGTSSSFAVQRGLVSQNPLLNLTKTQLSEIKAIRTEIKQLKDKFRLG